MLSAKVKLLSDWGPMVRPVLPQLPDHSLVSSHLSGLGLPSLLAALCRICRAVAGAHSQGCLSTSGTEEENDPPHRWEAHTHTGESPGCLGSSPAAAADMASPAAAAAAHSPSELLALPQALEGGGATQRL